MTSHGYPAGMRRSRLQQMAGTDAGLPPAPEPPGTPCSGAGGEPPTRRRGGGNAAALTCNGTPGPQERDKREETANG